MRWILSFKGIDPYARNRMTPSNLSWMEATLQGLAFWIGHRRAFFRHYPLPEEALVAEDCNFLQENKPDDVVGD